MNKLREICLLFQWGISKVVECTWYIHRLERLHRSNYIGLDLYWFIFFEYILKPTFIDIIFYRKRHTLTKLHNSNYIYM